MAKRGPRPNVELQKRAAELRAQGLTYREVGERLGVTPSRARQLNVAYYGNRPPPRPRPALTVPLILSWMDAHFQETGRWPDEYSGAVLGTPRENWGTLNRALQVGNRGLPGGTSLARLRRETGRCEQRPPEHPLTVQMILAWADAHFQATGQLPQRTVKNVIGASDETWPAIDIALRRGGRGLPGGWSLSRLLKEYRQLPERRGRPSSRAR